MPSVEDELEPSSQFCCDTEGSTGSLQKNGINILNQSMPSIKSPHVLNKIKTPSVLNKMQILTSQVFSSKKQLFMQSQGPEVQEQIFSSFQQPSKPKRLSILQAHKVDLPEEPQVMEVDEISSPISFKESHLIMYGQIVTSEEETETFVPNEQTYSYSMVETQSSKDKKDKLIAPSRRAS